MNRNEMSNIVIFSSLSFVELKLKNIKYEIHEIKIHQYLDMPDISSDGTVVLTRIADSEEFGVKYQSIEKNKRYIASLVSDPQGLIYTMYDHSSQITEASVENITKYEQYINLYDFINLGLQTENT